MGCGAVADWPEQPANVAVSTPKQTKVIRIAENFLQNPLKSGIVRHSAERDSGCLPASQVTP